MRQLFKEPKEEVNETLVLKGKMARYAAEKRKELIERLALFKKVVAEQKIKAEKEALAARKDDRKGNKAFSTRTTPVPEVAEALDDGQRVLAEPDDSMGSRKAQIPAP